MTGNPRARNLGQAAPSRLSSVSGARPVPTEPQPQDAWLDVDDVVELESRPAPAVTQAPNAAHPGALELEQRMREQQLELEQLRRESARRIQLAERERDAALAAVEELRASLRPEPGGAFAASSLAPPLQVQPPLTATAPLPLAHSARPVSLSPSRAPARVPADAPGAAPRADTLPQSRLREPGSVPTLSEVLVATDLLGHEPGAPDTDERRSEPRFSRQFEIEFNYETHFFAGLTLDISSGGLFIATYHLFPVGTALSLSFQLPDGRSLSVRGEVRWVRCASEGHERPGMGVAFKELAADALGAIAEFCEERPPLYVEL